MTIALLRDRYVLASAGAQVARALVRVMLLAVVLGLVASPALAADEGSRFVWDEVAVTVRLQDDGSARVREEDSVRFYGGPFRQGYREIPLAAIDDISQVTVTEVTNGTPREYTYAPPGAFFPNIAYTYTFQQVGTVMRIDWSFPPTTSALRAWVIEYTARGVVRVYDDADPPYEEIWWIGVDRELTRDAPVNRATLTIVLPRPVDPALAVADSDGTLFGGEDGQVWSWRAENLGAGDMLEASLRFPPLIGASKPLWQETRDRQIRREAPANLAFLGLALLTAVGGSVGLLAAWWTRGRDPQAGPVPDLLTEPPDDTPPGVVGTLLDEEVNQRDYIATMIDLGRRGVVRITTLEQPAMRRRRVMLTLLQPDAPLAPFEKALLTVLFAPTWWARAQVYLPLDNVNADTLREALDLVEHLLYIDLVQRGYFTQMPPGTRAAWRFGGIALWVIAVAVLLIGMGAASSIIWPLLASIALAALGAAVFALSWHMPQKTQAGAEAAARWRAFRNFLETAGRLGAMHDEPARFERYLPYAVAFGLQEPWIKAFARTQTAGTPRWYDVVNVDRHWLNSAWRAGGGVSLSDVSLPDPGSLQQLSSLTATSFQASSDTLFDLFNEMGDAFDPEKMLRSARGTDFDGGDIAMKIGVSVLKIALSGGRGSGGGGGGFS
jgi:hypothetical protein